MMNAEGKTDARSGRRRRLDVERNHERPVYHAERSVVLGHAHNPMRRIHTDVVGMTDPHPFPCHQHNVERHKWHRVKEVEERFDFHGGTVAMPTFRSTRRLPPQHLN